MDQRQRRLVCTGVLLLILHSPGAAADPGSIFSGPTSADALASYWNPAAMTMLPPGGHIQLHSTVMYARVSYQRDTLNPYDGQPYAEATLETPLPDPSLGVVFNAGLEDFRFGVSVTMPSMDGAKWDPVQGGKAASTRHYATEGMIIQLSLQPSVAYRINRYISVGIGMDIFMLMVESTVLADFGARINGYANRFCPSNCPLNPVVRREDPRLDAETTVSGSAWGTGGFIGVLISPLRWLHLGAIFRSGGGEVQIPIDLEVKIPDTLNDELNKKSLQHLVPELKARGSMSMVVPMSLAAAITVGPLWRFMLSADVRWVNRAKTGLNMVSIHQATSNMITDQSMILLNTDYVMIGARVELHPLEVLKLAFRFEYSPVTVPDEFLTPISMDFESYSLHIGLGWQITPWMGLLVEYTHYFLPAREISVSRFGPNPKPLTMIEEGFDRPRPTGRYEVKNDRFGLGFVFTM